jgi:ABC-type Na+ efflux pump permease subunit
MDNYQEVPPDDSVPQIPELQRPKRSRFSNTCFQVSIVVVSLAILSVMIFFVVYFATPGKKDLAAVYSQQIAALISPEKCRDNLFKLTRKPHMAGTKESNELATFVQNEFKKYGIDDVKLERYDVLLSYPTNGNILEVVDDVGGTKQLDLYEAAIQEDDSSKIDKTLVPPFVSCV